MVVCRYCFLSEAEGPYRAYIGLGHDTTEREKMITVGGSRQGGAKTHHRNISYTITPNQAKLIGL